jgi:hypothetical protein
LKCREFFDLVYTISVDRDDCFGSKFLMRDGIYNDPPQMCIRLSILQQKLSGLMAKDGIPNGLQSTTNDLISGGISGGVLYDDDQDVRLLCVCCILEILRLVPPPVTSDRNLVFIMKEIIFQISRLPSYDIGSAIGKRVYTLTFIFDTSTWNNLLFKKSVERGAANLLTSLFSTIISVFRLEQSKEGECLVTVIRMKIFSTTHA